MQTASPGVELGLCAVQLIWDVYRGCRQLANLGVEPGLCTAQLVCLLMIWTTNSGGELGLRIAHLGCVLRVLQCLELRTDFADIGVKKSACTNFSLISQNFVSNCHKLSGLTFLIPQRFINLIKTLLIWHLSLKNGKKHDYSR